MGIPTSDARQMGFFCPPPTTVRLKKAKIAVFFPVNRSALRRDWFEHRCMHHQTVDGLWHGVRPRAPRTIGIVRGSIACPVAALQAWRDAAGITTGPLFRSIRKGGKVGARLTDQSVANIVKTHAERVGLDPTLFAGHSLRAGFLTSAAKRGASIVKMMDVSRHRSVDTLRGYVRDAEIFKDHAGAGLL
jgi:hypothetical protein